MGAESIDVDLVLRLGERTRRVLFSSTAPIVGVRGPSGVGKSTLLRALAGVFDGAEGTLVVEGTTWLESATKLSIPPWKRPAAWVPQDSALFPHLSVIENLRYATIRGGGPPFEAKLVGDLEIGDLLARGVRHLSGGERQRVALGRALLSGRRWLLLDEPFSALDDARRERLRLALASFARERAHRIVLVSHDAEDLRALGADTFEMNADDGVSVAG